MIVIPAIDIIDNKPVRLYQGDYGKKEVVGGNVLEIAESFQRSGATYLHLVDLDGAKAGRLVNKATVIEVAKNLNIPVEVGGGIRTYDDAKYLLESGVSRIILGTAAIENLQLLRDLIMDFKERIAVGIDCRNGYLCTKGWLEQSKINYLDFIKVLETLGLENIIITDISKDGTLEGTNIKIIEELKATTKINIIASGGVKDLEDIKKLKELDIYGVIVGKAIYSKALVLEDALEICKVGDR